MKVLNVSFSYYLEIVLSVPIPLMQEMIWASHFNSFWHKQCFYLFLEAVWLYPRAMEWYYLSVAIDEELRKAPWNLFRELSLRVIEVWVLAEIAIDLASVGAVDFGLCEKWEFCSVKLFCKSFDILVACRFLVPELVAGERKNLEALISVFLMHLHKLCVGEVCQSSLRNDIDNKYGLFAFEYIS
jgi:hypothetical protein